MSNKLVVPSVGMTAGMPWRQIVISPKGLARMRDKACDWHALVGDRIVRCVNNPDIGYADTAPIWPPIAVTEIISTTQVASKYTTYDDVLAACAYVDLETLMWLTFVESENEA